MVFWGFVQLIDLDVLLIQILRGDIRNNHKPHTYLRKGAVTHR